MTTLKSIALLSLCLALPVAAQSDKPIRLAAPGFTGVNVDEKVATFFSEHFAQRLALAKIAVISSSEVATLVGLERQKQLMGCSEDSSSCLAELANALGADGVITGSIGKFGSIFQVNIKVLGANDAKALSIISKKAYSEEDLLEVLDNAAERTAWELKDKLRRKSSDDGDEPPPEEDSDEPPPEEDAPEEEPELGNVAVTAAQKTGAGKPNVFHFNALRLIFSQLALEYERSVAPNITVFVAPSIQFSVFAAEITVGGRYYFSSNAPEGLGFGLALAGATAGAGGVIAARAEGLYAFRLGDSFVLSFGLGAGGSLNSLGGVGGFFDLRGAAGFAF